MDYFKARLRRETRHDKTDIEVSWKFTAEYLTYKQYAIMNDHILNLIWFGFSVIYVLIFDYFQTFDTNNIKQNDLNSLNHLTECIYLGKSNLNCFITFYNFIKLI